VFHFVLPAFDFFFNFDLIFEVEADSHALSGAFIVSKKIGLVKSKLDSQNGAYLVGRLHHGLNRRGLHRSIGTVRAANRRRGNESVLVSPSRATALSRYSCEL